jgi:hypothetical protein
MSISVWSDVVLSDADVLDMAVLEMALADDGRADPDPATAWLYCMAETLFYLARANRAPSAALLTGLRFAAIAREGENGFAPPGDCFAAAANCFAAGGAAKQLRYLGPK